MLTLLQTKGKIRMSNQSKFICPDCRNRFRSIGFEFELWTTSIPGVPVRCRFCGAEGMWKDHMVTCIPVMFMKVIVLEHRP